MFLAGENFVFRDSKIKNHSVILKINGFILQLHNSLLQWDKMGTVAQSQQLIHQDTPGPSKKYPENIFYNNILYIMFLFLNIVLYLVPLVSHCTHFKILNELEKHWKVFINCIVDRRFNYFFSKNERSLSILASVVSLKCS